MKQNQARALFRGLVRHLQIYPKIRELGANSLFSPLFLVLSSLFSLVKNAGVSGKGIQTPASTRLFLNFWRSRTQGVFV
jgi:hypothetical protein